MITKLGVANPRAQANQAWPHFLVKMKVDRTARKSSGMIV